MKKALVLLFVVICALSFAIGTYLWALIYGPGSLQETTNIVVKKGDGVKRVAWLLQKDGVIESAQIFEILTKFYKSEGKLTVLNKVSARNLAVDFEMAFNKTISKSTVNKILYVKFGRPYKGVNSGLLTEVHIAQRLVFANEILEKNIKSSDIMFTDECKVISLEEAI